MRSGRGPAFDDALAGAILLDGYEASAQQVQARLLPAGRVRGSMLTAPDPEGTEVVLANSPVVDGAAPAVVVGGGSEDAEVHAHGHGSDACEAPARIERMGGLPPIARSDDRDGGTEERAQLGLIRPVPARRFHGLREGRSVRGHRLNPRPGAGVGAREGIDEAVAHEAAVVNLLAEIAAVGQCAAPVREGAPQGMVAPFPYEAAGMTGMPHLRGVASGISGAGSHRVQIFAHEVGGSANALTRSVVNPRGDVRGDGDLGMGIALVEDGGDFLQGRVHARVDVRVFEGMVTLVVDDRPGTGALVDPARAGDQVRAGAGLVTEAPAHDRGMVLVALEGPDRAVHVGVGPTRVVGGIIDPLPRPLEPVRLYVAFEHDPQADLVGEVEQAGMGRVVGGADRVDSHGLHEGEVLARPGLVEHAPLGGTHLVTVDTVEGQGLAVGHEHAVLDVHATETDAQAPLPRAKAFPALDADARLVEGWVLRAPRAHAAHFNAAAAIEAILAAFEGAGERPEAVDAEMPGQMSLLGAKHPSFDGRITHPGLVVSVDPQVLDGAGSEAA